VSSAATGRAAFTGCAAQADVPQPECDALAALYNATDGPNWVHHTDWLATDTPCLSWNFRR
jgi:hypothetical protein